MLGTTSQLAVVVYVPQFYHRLHPELTLVQHSYIAAGLGGKNGSIIIDLRGLKSISYNSTSQTAVIGTGNRLGDIIVALNNRGRALPHGTCAYVGWGGHISTVLWVCRAESSANNWQLTEGMGIPRGFGGLHSTQSLESRSYWRTGRLLKPQRLSTLISSGCVAVMCFAFFQSD